MLEPKDNNSTLDKVELGRMLFFDKRLSLDESVSCATCHVPEYAFTDRFKFSTGIKGRKTMRNASSVLNSGYLETVMYDGYLPSLEMQIEVPIQEHTEMGMKMGNLIKRLQKDPEYVEAAKRIFNREFDVWVLSRSIAAYERSLISDNSRFDQYYYQHKKNALTDAEIEGWKLFSDKLYCTQCHPAPYFTTFKTANNGLYEDYGEDQGRFRIHNDSTEIGTFKIPSLRNVALTYPYMHDGSIESLREIIQHYRKGGAGHKFQDRRIIPFRLNQQEEKNLVSFLQALTDTSYLKKSK